MKIDIIIVGDLYVNCYIISKNKDAIIIDPGSDFEKIKSFIDSNELKPLAIVNTHGHFDHVGAIEDLKSEYNIPLYMHEGDEFLLKNAVEHASMFGIFGIKSSNIDNYLEDNQLLAFGDIKLKVLHTPGHSPGGVSLYLGEAKAVFTGDTLFKDSVGRTDFPYADFNTLANSIKNKLYVLDDDVTVYPGHGPSSTIGYEKKMNAFVRLG